MSLLAHVPDTVRQLCLEWRKGKREEDELSAKLDAIQQEIDQVDIEGRCQTYESRCLVQIESKQMLVRKLKKLQRETEEFKDTQSRSTGSLGMLQRTLVESDPPSSLARADGV